MSGYLRRLVETASAPRQGVRPRTGSIFSPPREQTGVPLEGWDEVVAPPDVELPDRPQPIAPQADPAPLLPTLAPADRGSLAQAAPSPDAARFAAGDGDDVLDAPETELASHEPNRAPGDIVDLTVPAAAGARGAFGPVAAARPRWSRAGEPTDAPRAFPAAPGAAPADDIQIHIGRIEVIAAPPPATRAPKAPDRSLSLDAYLNRRDGRTR